MRVCVSLSACLCVTGRQKKGGICVWVGDKIVSECSHRGSVGTKKCWCFISELAVMLASVKLNMRYLLHSVWMSVLLFAFVELLCNNSNPVMHPTELI